jgi:ABC-type phosphonate transport system ATPase subunit
MNLKFSPAQQEAFDDLSRLLTIGSVFVLYGDIGSGKSTVLGEIHRQIGGAFLSVRNFVEAMRDRHPLAMEETFEHMVMEAISANDAVIVDDLNLMSSSVASISLQLRRTGWITTRSTALRRSSTLIN